MDELTKMWQVWDRTKINRLECDTHKNVRATKNVFKVKRCGSSLLTSNRKMNLEKTVDF
jgi:hypothetical protein